jgi:predicted GNAT superfamily acetyltransferase
MGRVVGRSTPTSTPTNTNTIITNTLITNTKRKTNKEKIEEFVPNETSEQAVRDEYANATKGEVNKLILDFKDQMLNRTAKWKDIQSCFRNYLSKGYIKINEQKAESFSQIKKMVNSKKTKPMTLEQIKQYALEDSNVH